MQLRLAQWLNTEVPPNFPGPDPASNPARYGGAWSPGWCWCRRQNPPLLISRSQIWMSLNCVDNQSEESEDHWASSSLLLFFVGCSLWHTLTMSLAAVNKFQWQLLVCCDVISQYILICLILVIWRFVAVSDSPLLPETCGSVHRTWASHC